MYTDWPGREPLRPAAARLDRDHLLDLRRRPGSCRPRPDSGEKARPALPDGLIQRINPRTPAQLQGVIGHRRPRREAGENGGKNEACGAFHGAPPGLSGQAALWYRLVGLGETGPIPALVVGVPPDSQNQDIEGRRVCQSEMIRAPGLTAPRAAKPEPPSKTPSRPPSAISCRSRRADGHWCGELEGDTILESEYVLTMHFLGRTGEDARPEGRRAPAAQAAARPAAGRSTRAGRPRSARRSRPTSS